MKLSLVKKVLISVIVLFIVTAAILSYAVANQIRQAYLSEQKRNVAEFVEKQARQHLSKEDFQTKNIAATLPKFAVYQNEIITLQIVRVKIYNTKGIVIYSDQKELIGQNLFADDPNELSEILQGNVVADIAKPDKAENIYEKQYKQLLEIYTPIKFDDSNIVGVVEVYYQLDVLNSEIFKSQTYLVASIGFIFAILFVVIFFIVKKASKTIIEQDKQLKVDIQKVSEYASLKDEFIRMSSHQLRTPASAIKWSVELLKDASTGKMSEEQNKLLESIDISNESLIAIVDNLLIVSDIKQDYFILEKEAYALLGVTQEVLKNKEEKIKKKNLTVTVTSSQYVKNITLRKDAIKKVVSNLLDNAIDYTPAKGNITIQITQKEANVAFEITDTGIGIPENEKTKVFDKFFRASNSIEQKNVGSGLSLYIVKKILEGYNGKIWLESNKNGSKFIFEIPKSAG